MSQVQMAQPGQAAQPTIVMQAPAPAKEGWSFSAKCCLCACITSTVIAVIIIIIIVSLAAAVTSTVSSGISAGGFNIDSNFGGLSACGVSESGSCMFDMECNGERTCYSGDCVGSSGC